jgi:hypothetical protein
VIYNRYTDFRYFFAKRATSSDSFTFVQNGAGDRITRPSGSFVTDGVLAGMQVKPQGSTSNDALGYTVAMVAATQLTLVDANQVVAEGPTICALKSAFVAKDGMEEWPGLTAGQAGHSNIVRAGGFNGGFTGIPTPYNGNGFDVTVNAYGVDATQNVDEYDWYLSQRTDDPAKQYLTIAAPYSHIAVPPNSLSGTVGIRHTALAEAELFPGAVTIVWGVDQIIELFKFCQLYVRRRSDGTIQWADLLKSTFSAT